MTLYNVSRFVFRTVLIVKLIKGEEFPQYAGDSPNVFLELKLVPAMKKEILKTDIHERNANPNLNEVFEFGLLYDVVKQQNLSFTLMYMDKFSHPFPVGEVTHHLDHLEMVGAGTAREEIIVCREIQRLQQVRGLLTVAINRCRQILQQLRAAGSRCKSYGKARLR